MILQQCSTENSIKHFKWFRNESWLGNFNCWQPVELSMSWLQIRFSPDYKQDVREALKINCPYCDHHDPLEIDLHVDGFSAELLTYILIRRSIGHQPAIKFLESIAASPRVIKIYSDSVIEETAEDILRQYEDQDFSYTDAVSFVVMKQYGITQAFCFDKHFLTAGFKLIQ